jgi:hypothetical protein
MDNEDVKTRGRLAVWVATGGLAAVAVLSTVTIWQEPTEAKTILTMILPVVGTWVGTVLAFYFAKENLLAATQSTKELLGLNERLRKIPVEKAMLSISDSSVTRKQLAKGEDAQQLKLVDLSKLMRDAGRNRLPVLQADGTALFIIHLSTLTDFLAQKAVAAPSARLGDSSIADLKADGPKLYEAILKFGIVKRSATLAEAKGILEARPGCADVFVTENGQASEPVVGWVTNVEIGLRSQA